MSLTVPRALSRIHHTPQNSFLKRAFQERNELYRQRLLLLARSRVPLATGSALSQWIKTIDLDKEGSCVVRFRVAPDAF